MYDNNKLMLMTKMFYFTVNDVDVDNHCDRDNNQDHTIEHLKYDVISTTFLESSNCVRDDTTCTMCTTVSDTTTSDNEFHNTCTTTCVTIDAKFTISFLDISHRITFIII